MIRGYTTLGQSKKLSEILPLKSADMHYERVYFEGKQSDWFIELGTPIKSDDIIPCWSLVALLEQFENAAGLAKDYGLWFCYDNRKSHCTKHYDNPVDAAYEFICWLLENKKL